MSEMPTFLATTYGNQSVGRVWNLAGGQPVMPNFPNAQALTRFVKPSYEKEQQPKPKQETKPMSDRRLVRVLIVDPHKDVPTESALLYDSKELFTDKTDQELYFDVAIGDLLKAHNEVRTKIVDKSVKERTEHLEPARIRDLKMLVITLAEF